MRHKRVTLWGIFRSLWGGKMCHRGARHPHRYHIFQAVLSCSDFLPLHFFYTSSALFSLFISIITKYLFPHCTVSLQTCGSLPDSEDNISFWYFPQKKSLTLLCNYCVTSLDIWFLVDDDIGWGYLMGVSFLICVLVKHLLANIQSVNISFLIFVGIAEQAFL